MENQRRGHFSLFRSLLSTDWAKDTAKLALWVRLIGEASYKPRTVDFAGRSWNLMAGQLVTTTVILARNLRDQDGNEKSSKAVERMINFFVKEGMLIKKGTPFGTVITLTNFDEYQNVEKISVEPKASNGAGLIGIGVEPPSVEPFVEPFVEPKASNGAGLEAVSVEPSVEPSVEQNKKVVNKNIKTYKNTMPEQVQAEDEKPPSEPAKQNPVDEAFESTFWCAGMVKTGKKSAKSAFATQFKEWRKQSGGSPIQFAQFLADDIACRKGKQFGFEKLHPTTYLNGKRWEDEKPGSPTTTQTTAAVFYGKDSFHADFSKL